MKFFRVEKQWIIDFLKKLGERFGVYEIDKSVFDWEEEPIKTNQDKSLTIVTDKGSYWIENNKVYFANKEFLTTSYTHEGLIDFVFGRDKEKPKDTCSITKKHNYQPSICVHCGKQKPKKIEKVDRELEGNYAYWRTVLLDRVLDKQDQIIEVINER